MSATGQFIFFLIAIILFGIASVMRMLNKAVTYIDSALVSAGLASWMFVLVYNAAKEM